MKPTPHNLMLPKGLAKSLGTVMATVALSLAGACLSDGPTPPASRDGRALGSSSAPTSGLALRSPEVADGGTLPTDYTGDGSSATLPLEWTTVPAGTRSLTLIMHHVAPDKVKWYWILYNIPPETRSLPRNVVGVGTLGNNSVNGRQEYAPPHSKGPGPKTYVYTLYALSSPVSPGVRPADVTRDVLLGVMKDKILASAELRVVYTRNAPGSGSEQNR